MLEIAIEDADHRAGRQPVAQRREAAHVAEPQRGVELAAGAAPELAGQHAARGVGAEVDLEQRTGGETRAEQLHVQGEQRRQRGQEGQLRIVEAAGTPGGVADPGSVGGARIHQRQQVVGGAGRGHVAQHLEAVAFVLAVEAATQGRRPAREQRLGRRADEVGGAGYRVRPARDAGALAGRPHQLVAPQFGVLGRDPDAYPVQGEIGCAQARHQALQEFGGIERAGRRIEQPGRDRGGRVGHRAERGAGQSGCCPRDPRTDASSRSLAGMPLPPRGGTQRLARSRPGREVDRRACAAAAAVPPVIQIAASAVHLPGFDEIQSPAPQTRLAEP